MLIIADFKNNMIWFQLVQTLDVLAVVLDVQLVKTLLLFIILLLLLLLFITLL